jgi:excisionase family DNA binding protein
VSATLTIPEVAELLGVSRNTAYEQARSGQIAGVNVIRVGSRLLVPRKPLLELLGEDEGPAEADPSTVFFGPALTGSTSHATPGNGRRHVTD